MKPSNKIPLELTFSILLGWIAATGIAIVLLIVNN
jgi:hypothetical protein